MKFEDALNLKNKIGETKTIEDIIYKVCIVPDSNDDFSAYLAGYLKGTFTDESAKLYSKNLEFKVFGIKQVMSKFFYQELYD